MRLFNNLILSVTLSALPVLTGCAQISPHLNPLSEPPKAEALLGDKDDNALNEDKNKTDSAREALNAMASYQRTSLPQPNNPVMQPAVVRLMWIPDHLNKSGDLVPSHYYYVKVRSDRWAVQDAFELEEQLGARGDSTNVPYVLSDKKR